MSSRRRAIAFFCLVLIVCASVITGCGRNGQERAVSTVDLTGAGATFPFPVYRQWIADYMQRTGGRINYLSVGSAEGMRLLAAGDVEFGAVDREPTTAELGTASCSRIAVPMLVGAVAVVYHLPGVEQPLRLDAPALRAIYDGTVMRWNAGVIARQNPGVRLPATPIVVVHREAGSATSLSFAAYIRGPARPAALAPTDPAWKVGYAAKGNEGVAAQVQQTVGAIGYVELAYAAPSGLPVALLKNGAGEYARPSEATLNTTVMKGLEGRADAQGAALVGLPMSGTYPIGAITWLVLDPARLGKQKGRKVVAFAEWALREGSESARRLEYVPLPPAIVAHYDSMLAALTFAPCTPGSSAQGQ